VYEWLLEQRRKGNGSAATAGRRPGPGAAPAAAIEAEKAHHEAHRKAKPEGERRTTEAPKSGPFAERSLKPAETHPDTPAASLTDLWRAACNAPGSAAGKRALGILKGGRLARADAEELVQALEWGHSPELMPLVLDVVKRQLDHPRAAWLLT